MGKAESQSKDQQILERIRQRDESALDYLYQKNYRMMVRMVQRNSGSEEEAKDIYQEALIVFWRKAASEDFVLTSKISTYLYSICQNLWRKELDRKARLSNEEKDSSEDMDTDSEERIRIVNEAIDALSENCARLLRLHYFDRLSMAEIAEQMGFANSDTAKTKKYKCKKELEKRLKTLYTAGDFLD